MEIDTQRCGQGREKSGEAVTLWKLMYRRLRIQYCGMSSFYGMSRFNKKRLHIHVICPLQFENFKEITNRDAR